MLSALNIILYFGLFGMIKTKYNCYLNVRRYIFYLNQYPLYQYRTIRVIVPNLPQAASNQYHKIIAHQYYKPFEMHNFHRSPFRLRSLLLGFQYE